MPAKYDKLESVIEMSKKFREYRMFFICLILFIIFICVGIISLLNHHTGPMIGSFLLALIALLLLLFRYKMVLFDDMMMIYEWKVAVMLPTIIAYKDIHAIEKKSKHHLIITHQHVSHVYVFDSDLFLSTYQSFNKSHF